MEARMDAKLSDEDDEDEAFLRMVTWPEEDRHKFTSAPWRGEDRWRGRDHRVNTDLLISDGCDWSGVIAKLFAKSMRPTRKAG
jgi:hypothetical protein